MLEQLLHPVASGFCEVDVVSLTVVLDERPLGGDGKIPLCRRYFFELW
jgi:hypothetical protein